MERGRRPGISKVTNRPESNGLEEVAETKGRVGELGLAAVGVPTVVEGIKANPRRSSTAQLDLAGVKGRGRRAAVLWRAYHRGPRRWRTCHHLGPPTRRLYWPSGTASRRSSARSWSEVEHLAGGKPVLALLVTDEEEQGERAGLTEDSGRRDSIVQQINTYNVQNHQAKANGETNNETTGACVRATDIGPVQ